MRFYKVTYYKLYGLFTTTKNPKQGLKPTCSQQSSLSTTKGSQNQTPATPSLTQNMHLSTEHYTGWVSKIH